jgi:hypothetical protein
LCAEPNDRRDDERGGQRDDVTEQILESQIPNPKSQVRQYLSTV